MVNVRGIANKAIQGVNPDIDATLSICTGSDVNKAGKQTPKYDDYPVRIQNQSVTSDDLKLINTLNMDSGTYRSIYIRGNMDGINRIKQKGADLLEFKQYPDADTSIWKIVQVIESWPTWCRVLVCRQ